MVQKFQDWLLQREGSGFVIDTGDPEDARHIPKVTNDEGSPLGGDPIFKKKSNFRCSKRSKRSKRSDV